MTAATMSSFAYPIKITSRSATTKRKRKSRLCWTLMATAFGIGCAFSLTSFSAGTGNMTAAAPVAVAPTVTPIVKAQATVPSLAPVNQAIISPSRPLEAIIAAEPANLPVLLIEKPAAIAAVTYPHVVTLKVKSGDSLSSLLNNAGVSGDEARNLVDSVGRNYDVKKMEVGQHVAVTLDRSKTAAGALIVSDLKFPLSPLAELEVTRNKNADFAMKKIDAPIERKLARAGGPIASSLYETVTDAGLPPVLLSEIINAYSYDVDFQRDIKQGDNIDVLYERMQTKDGVNAGHGNVIYAELDLGDDRQLKIYRYVDKSGNADYYSENGESLRKALLRTPVNGARITSGFGARFHPLLGYTRMHRGVDFGAPIGTPIYAAGDGTVEFVGRKNGFGNYLKIKHNEKYASAYAHISRFAAGMAAGHKVKQGQIIAYVGMTGMATGPHLHYEILVNNEQVNPSNVKFKTGNVLQGKELYAFRKNIAQIQTQLASLPKAGNAVAMLETDKAEVN